MLDVMKKVAVAAGKLAVERRRELKVEDVRSKGNPADLVTIVDQEVERFIVGKLQEATPGFGFFGEEYGSVNPGAEWCYCIDPIDGTTSFVHDSFVWSVSIGLLHNNEHCCGVVYVPKLDELYAAETGKGATLNGAPIHVSGCRELQSALAATGFACVRARWNENNLPRFCKMLPLIQGIRRSGSAAFDICQVAAGRYDLFWEKPLQPYDIAAGVVIAREAGAVISDYKGGNELTGEGFICSAPGVYAEAFEVLRA